jgi:tRNA(Ile)-lysidine synthase
MAVPGGLIALEHSILDRMRSLEPGPLIVALSGGADSAIAAWACAEARPPDSVRAVYVDHGWEASPRLEKAAQAIADQLGIDLEVQRVEMPEGASPEGGARDVRLEALAETAGGARVVTGHHADDAAETVLVNILRGAGVTGLTGIPQNREPFVRPLLPFRRAELRSLAEHLHLPFVDDPSNDDVTLLRNRIRHELLPELSRRFDRDVAPVMVRTASQLAAVDELLEGITPPVTLIEDEGAVLVAKAPLTTAAGALSGRMARVALRHANPPYAGTSREVEAVLAVARGEVDRADLSSGWIVEGEGPHVAIHQPVAATIPEPASLPVPGSVRLGSHLVAARPASSGDKGHMSHDRVRVVGRGELSVRSARPGDRIDVMGGTKTVSDAMGEAGIPRRKRLAWPVVESRARIIWVAGVRVAVWARDSEPRDTWIELERRTV